jgi:hypothetical protein
MRAKAAWNADTAAASTNSASFEKRTRDGRRMDERALRVLRGDGLGSSERGVNAECGAQRA